jgi:2-C-methyl-D-erythritol 2,4-cyclodiphosphate synthase
MFRIGHGYDVHKLVAGRKLILGGVNIPFEKGLLGHSDADVVVHAVMDALLGAAGLGDIGQHFPDSDENYRNISSLILLKRTNELIKLHGFSIGNIDATIVCQKPKLAEFIPKMRENIAGVLECDISVINVKATTEEGLGFTGSLDGIAAHAVCLLEKFHFETSQKTAR